MDFRPQSSSEHRKRTSTSSFNGLTFSLQQLLLHHESYVISARREHDSMSARIAQLEAENARLHAENVAVLGENKELAEQVSELNDAVIQSDKTIYTLQSTLDTTHHELERLRKLAARADDLDAELSALELDKLTLQDALASTTAEHHDADRKWSSSQRALAALQAQLEIVELDAAEERRRHTALAKRCDAHAAERHTLEQHQRAARARDRAVSDAVRDLVAETAKVRHQNAALQRDLAGERAHVERLRRELEDARRLGSAASLTLEDELRGCRPPTSNRVSFAPSQASTLFDSAAGDLAVSASLESAIDGGVEKLLLRGRPSVEKLRETAAAARIRKPMLPIREAPWEWGGAVLTEATIHAPKARQPSRSGMAALQGLLGR